MLSTTVGTDGEVEVLVEGGIDGEALAALRSTIEAEAERHGPVRLLVRVQRFDGVSAAAVREDLRSLGLLKAIGRYAVVTDVRWIRTTAPAAFAVLPVDGRVFQDRDEALAWLRS